MIRVLVVPPEGPATVEQIEPTLEAMRAAIGGGLLEGVSMPAGAHGYCDEEGNIRQPPLPINGAASLLFAVGGGGQMLRGPVVVLGHTDDGGEADVPEGLLAVAREHGLL